MKKTKITKWAALALAASVTLSLAACGGNGGSAPEGTSGGGAASQQVGGDQAGTSGESGGAKELVVATVSAAGSLDPAEVAIDMWTEYAKLCVDPLIRFDESGNVIYEAAESYESSDDGLVWTFHLRQDAKWSDGSMDDVMVKALDDYTLEFTLTEPCGYFLKLLTIAPFYPSKSGVATLENTNWYKDGATSLGNGPFCLKEFVDGQYYLVEKNPYYFAADQVKLDSIRVEFIDDAQALLSSYRTGEVDVVTGLPSYVKEQYQDSDGYIASTSYVAEYMLSNNSD